METLSYIDPPADEPGWRKIVAAIEAVPLLGDADGEEIAVKWSRSELDRDGRYGECRPDGYTNDEDVRQKYWEATRQRKAREKAGKRVTGFKSLLELAYKGGMVETARIPAEWLTQPQDAPAPTTDGIEVLDFHEARRIPAPLPVICGLLYQRENVALVAVLKSGKTFVGLDLTMSIASGLPVFGNSEGLLAENTGAVVYLSGEGHAGIPARLDAWMQERGAEGELPFYYVPRVPKATIRGEPQHVRSFCSQYRGSLGSRRQCGPAPGSRARML